MLVIATEYKFSIIIIELIRILSLQITENRCSHSAYVAGNVNSIFRRMKKYGNLGLLDF